MLLLGIKFATLLFWYYQSQIIKKCKCDVCTHFMTSIPSFIKVSQFGFKPTRWNKYTLRLDMITPEKCIPSYQMIVV